MTSDPKPHPAALEQYRRRASIYDAELAMFEPLRRSAVARLGLRRGDTVLDVGCGTGLSLPLLQEAVGPGGSIIGIEQSPEMLRLARERVDGQRWRNVTLIEAPVAAAVIEVRADAALFHFTHDILRDESAIANVARALPGGARVVASGLQWSAPWLWPVNLFVLGAALHSVTSLAGLAQPWSLLAARLDGLQVDALAAGGLFLASGSLRTARALALAEVA